jgi:hypothetical protein
MQHSQFETQLPQLVRGYLKDASDEVEPNADHTACLKGWEKRSAVQLQKTAQVQDIPAKDLEHRLKGINRPEWKSMSPTDCCSVV